MKISITYSFTDQQILDFLDTAGRGSRYWNESSLELVAGANDALFGMKGTNILDSEDGKEYSLNRDKIENGLEIMAKKYPKHFIDFAVREDYDEMTGDVFLQCALFGEVIYS